MSLHFATDSLPRSLTVHQPTIGAPKVFIVRLLMGVLLVLYGRTLYWVFVAVAGFLLGFALATEFLAAQAESVRIIVAFLAGVRRCTRYACSTRRVFNWWPVRRRLSCFGSGSGRRVARGTTCLVRYRRNSWRDHRSARDGLGNHRAFEPGRCRRDRRRAQLERFRRDAPFCRAKRDWNHDTGSTTFACGLWSAIGN